MKSKVKQTIGQDEGLALPLFALVDHSHSSPVIMLASEKPKLDIAVKRMMTMRFRCDGTRSITWGMWKMMTRDPSTLSQLATKAKRRLGRLRSSSTLYRSFTPISVADGTAPTTAVPGKEASVGIADDGEGSVEEEVAVAAPCPDDRARSRDKRADHGIVYKRRGTRIAADR